MMMPMAETIKGGSCLIKSWSIFICFLDNNWLEIWGFICSFYVCLWKSNIHFICRKASAACHKLTVMIFLLSTANGFSYGFPISMQSSALCWGKNSASFHVSFKKRLIKFMIALVSSNAILVKMFEGYSLFINGPTNTFFLWIYTLYIW